MHFLTVEQVLNHKLFMALTLPIEFANPFLSSRFHIVIESRHGDDAGNSENIFGLSEDELAQRKVIWIDIAGDKISESRPEREPSTFLSAKTGRGNLKGEWWKNHEPIMCCYKLVTIKFQVFGLQTRVEDIIMRVCAGLGDSKCDSANRRSF